MQLFIDTNILLSFYALNQEDLGELRKLADRVINKEVTLLITDQIIDEFYRNREQRIEGSLKSFYGQTFNPQLPQICEYYPQEAERLRSALKEYEQAHSVMVARVALDIKAKNLQTDQIIRSFFENGHKVVLDQTIIDRARLRMGVGNPPGKNNSLGDAINWECLLHVVPYRTDLFLISGDKDYSSPLGDDELSGFLRDEWERRKQSKILFYRRLSGFFKDQFPDIGMANSRDRDYLVRELSNSQSLADVQKIVTRLISYPEFTAGQANGILLAALNNQRVAWSIDDENVRGFLLDIRTRYQQYLDVEMLDRLKSLFEQKKDVPE
jgi:predicted nucleic acid-binding protein